MSSSNLTYRWKRLQSWYGEVVDQVDVFSLLGSMIIKDGGSSVHIRRRLAKTKTKTSMSTLSNIWKDRNITWATKIRVIMALVFPIASMDVRHGLSERQTGEQYQPLRCGVEKAAWDIIERSHHQWTRTVPHWQIPIINYQDWSAHAKILWSCLQKGRRPLWKKKKKHHSRHLWRDP